jgi:hypothetical protein
MSLRSSDHPFRRLAGIGTATVLLILAGGWIVRARPDRTAGANAFWVAGVPRPIAVRGGRTTFRVATPRPASETLVVVSALSRSPGPFPIRLTARPAPRAEIPLPADDGPQRDPATDAPEPPLKPSSPPSSGAGLPPAERVFHVMVRDGDPESRGNYVAVKAALRGVGRQVQVYVAIEDIGNVGRGLLEDTITTFDDRVHPAACDRYGPARDVDRDGRFTILFSSWLDRLSGGRHAVDGFIKVADLDPTVAEPFGNRCDMMYLNARLRAGPYLRTILAHEYMHAVIYSRKSLDRAGRGGPRPEEEGWLDEALAHLAEDSHGFSRSNIDYRISAYLSRPDAYRLVVDDYFAADLFRSHGNRGGTYLFLRWCADRYGPGLIPALVLSDRRGTDNLEAATGSTFAALFRRWSLAMFLSGLEPSGGDGFRSLNLRAPMADRELAGPRPRRMAPGGPADCWEAAGTSPHYVILDGDPAGAVDVEVEGPPEAAIQVTVLPLGDDHARLSLALEADRGPGGEWTVRARIGESHGVPVRLSALSWEPMVPGPRTQLEDRCAGRLDMLGIASSFGTSLLPAGGELRSRPIRLDGTPVEGTPLLFKIVGTDPRGRRVCAWAEIEAPTPASSDASR